MKTLQSYCTNYRIAIRLREAIILDTKEAILKKARKLFAKHGFDGVSIRTICDKIPCNVSAAISYHFGSKEGLYRECFQEEGQDVLALIKTVLTAPENETDLKNKLEKFLIQFFDHCYKNRETILIIGKDVGSKSAMDSIEKIFNEIPCGIISFLKIAQDRKFIRTDLNIAYICSFLIDPLFMQILFLDHEKPKRNFSDPDVRKDFIRQQLSLIFSSLF